jgi:hypothetical protein
MSVLDDKGAALRIATLSQSGPFEDLVKLLEERQNVLADSILDKDEALDIARAQREARGFRDALNFIRDTVAALAAEYGVTDDKLT